MDAPPALDFDRRHREALPPRLAAGNGALLARADGQVEHLERVASRGRPGTGSD